MPSAGALSVVYSRFSSACCKRGLRLLHAGLGRRRRAPAWPRPAAGAVCALLQRARCACCSPARACAHAGFRATRIAGLRLRDLRARRIGRGARARRPPPTAASNCCCEISSFASSALSRSTSAPSWSRWLRPRAAAPARRRAARVATRCRAAPARRRPAASSTPPRAVRDVAASSIVDAIGTLRWPPAALASASASSAFARSTATW